MSNLTPPKLAADAGTLDEINRLRAIIEAAQLALKAPLDPEQVVDDHYGRALWGAFCGNTAYGILSEIEHDEVTEGSLATRDAEMKAAGAREQLTADLAALERIRTHHRPSDFGSGWWNSMVDDAVAAITGKPETTVRLNEEK